MVGLTVWLVLQAGKRDPGWNICLSKKEKRFLAVLCAFTETGLLMWCLSGYPQGILSAPGSGMFLGCLIAASVMDQKEKMVYRFVWAAAAIAAAGYVFSESVCGSVAEYALFVLLQQGLFSRWYGKADCYAFSLCGLIWLARQDTFRICVFHMAVSFGLLVIVQILRKNIAADGNCKEAVPMLPYITAGYAVCFFGQIFGRVSVVDFQGQRW